MKVVIHTRTSAAIEYEAEELRYEIDKAWVHVIRVDPHPTRLLGPRAEVRIGSVARDAVLSVSLVDGDLAPAPVPVRA